MTYHLVGSQRLSFWPLYRDHLSIDYLTTFGNCVTFQDSLHEDLDLEAQLRIMQTFSHASQHEIPEAPPPYSSVVPPPGELDPSLAQGRGHKRQPCFYFLSGYCRNGMECPDYHGMDPDLEELEVCCREAVCMEESG